MSDKGFLFNVVSNIGAGHQVQVAFNLDTGATRKQMDAILDEYFAAIKRQEARLRVPTIETEVLRQRAQIAGAQKEIDRLHDLPALNGKRRAQDEAQYQHALTQLSADRDKLDILEKNLAETYKEAEVDGSCLQRVS